jgi:hypothetical protein
MVQIVDDSTACSWAPLRSAAWTSAPTAVPRLGRQAEEIYPCWGGSPAKAVIDSSSRSDARVPYDITSPSALEILHAVRHRPAGGRDETTLSDLAAHLLSAVPDLLGIARHNHRALDRNASRPA